MNSERLDERPSQEVPALAAQLRLSVARLGRRLRSERDTADDLSLGQLSILRVLYLYGETTMGALAAHERVQPPAITRTVAFLEDSGYVTRRGHETDGRLILVTLTPIGSRILEADARRRDEWLAQRLRPLTAEQREALRTAAALMDELARG